VCTWNVSRRAGEVLSGIPLRGNVTVRDSGLKRAERFSDDLESHCALGEARPGVPSRFLEKLPGLQTPCDCALFGLETRDNFPSRRRRPLARIRKIGLGTHRRASTDARKYSFSSQGLGQIDCIPMSGRRGDVKAMFGHSGQCLGPRDSIRFGGFHSHRSINLQCWPTRLAGTLGATGAWICGP